MRVRLYQADLAYGGGLVLHTASSGSVPILSELYLTLEDQHATGLGEVRINIAYLNGLSPETVRNDAVGALESADWTRDAGDLLATMAEWTGANTAPARTLIDCALHDYLARREGKSLAALLGASVGAPVEAATNQTLFWSSLDDYLARARRYVERGFRDLKVRVAAGRFEEDLERIALLRQCFGAGVKIAADANGQWSEAGARERIAQLAAFDLAYVEQPLPAGQDAEMLRLAAASPIPIMLDESVASPSDLDRIIAAGGAVWAHLKLVKLGGIAPTLSAARRLNEAGIPFMVGQMNEGAAATAAALHVACAVRAPFAELYGADGLSNDPVTGVHYEVGTVASGAGPGLGVHFDASRAHLLQEF
jgi:L-alanine-DL-glutamate epimerase-like enolase superfamily enzyme